MPDQPDEAGSKTAPDRGGHHMIVTHEVTNVGMIALSSLHCATIRSAFSMGDFIRPVAVCAMLLATACVPYVMKDYKMSAQHSSVAHGCGMGPDSLYFEFPGNVRVYLHAPRQPGKSDTIGMSIEIPAGDTVRLTDGSASVFVNPGSTQWQASVVARGGYHYINPESSQIVKDPDGGDPTRDLVGSTWNTHRFGEHLHSFYYFEIGSEVPWPDRFNLRVSPMIIDGVEAGLPTVMFQFGPHGGVAGLGCS